MRPAFMFTQKGLATYQEDMTFGATTEPGDPGSCRRR